MFRRCRCGSLNVSETGESTKCPWVGVVEGTAGGKKYSFIFSALSPHAINPTTPTQGQFVLASRDQDDGPVELNDRHLPCHGKIGDCEQSIQLPATRPNALLSDARSVSAKQIKFSNDCPWKRITPTLVCIVASAKICAFSHSPAVCWLLKWEKAENPALVALAPYRVDITRSKCFPKITRHYSV